MKKKTAVAGAGAGGFENITHAPLGSWRKPILHTFLAQKPLL